MHHSVVESKLYTHLLPMSLIDGPGTPMYNTPPTLSVTQTLNWYCSPRISPDTTPVETLAGKVVEKLIIQIV